MSSPVLPPDHLEIRTRPTLLAGIASQGDHDAWLRFYEMYQHVILGMAFRWGLSEPSARDVLQDVMLAVSRTAPSFSYDRERRIFHAHGDTTKEREKTYGNFRQWLFTIVNRTIWKYRYAPRRIREISFGDIQEPRDLDRLRQHFGDASATQETPDHLAAEKAEQDYRLALLEQAIRMLPDCSKRSHPRKLAIFLALKQPGVFAYITRMNSAPLPPSHMQEISALAKLRRAPGCELTKSDVMAHYRMSSNHVDQEVKAVKVRLQRIFADLRCGRDPRSF